MLRIHLSEWIVSAVWESPVRGGRREGGGAKSIAMGREIGKRAGESETQQHNGREKGKRDRPRLKKFPGSSEKLQIPIVQARFGKVET